MTPTMNTEQPEGKSKKVWTAPILEVHPVKSITLTGPNAGMDQLVDPGNIIGSS